MITVKRSPFTTYLIQLKQKIEATCNGGGIFRTETSTANGRSDLHQALTVIKRIGIDEYFITTRSQNNVVTWTIQKA